MHSSGECLEHWILELKIHKALQTGKCTKVRHEGIWTQPIFNLQWNLMSEAPRFHLTIYLPIFATSHKSDNIFIM